MAPTGDAADPRLAGAARPGQAVRAIETGDAPVVQDVVLVAALFVMVANLVVDILYAILDPRVQLS